MEKKNVYGLKAQYRDFKCTACGHIQSMYTNHTGTCYDYCKSCSWKVSQYPGVEMFGHMYRLFAFDNVAEVQAVLNDTQLNPRVPALYELQDTMGEYSIAAADPEDAMDEALDFCESPEYLQTEPISEIDD